MRVPPEGALPARASRRLRSAAAALALAASGALLAGCEPTLFSGKSPNVVAAEEARAHGDGPGALRAYERALVEDDLMQGERTQVALAMAEADQKSAASDVVETYQRLLARGDLDAGTRAVALSRLVVAGDRLAGAGRPAEAAKLFELVLVEGGTSLTGRDAVLARLRRASERVARLELDALAPQPPSLDKLAKLAAARRELHRVGASKELVTEVTRAMTVAAEGAFVQAEQLEREGKHAASLRFADALLAPLPEERSLRAKRDDLAARVGLRFETMIVGAQGYPGALALRTGWMLRATGRAHPSRKGALEDLDRRARAQYSVQITPTACSDVARDLAGGFGGAKGVIVATRLEVGRCQRDVQESSRQEPYTYYVTETYTEQETRYDTVTEQQGQDCHTTYLGNGQTSQQCSPHYTTRQVPRTETVTKTRQVPRTGYKTIVTTTFTYDLAGAVRMNAEERAVLQPFATSGRAVQTTTTGGPEGAHTEGGNADDALREAYERAAAALRDARLRMDQERARAWIDRAARAEAQGRELEAEDAHATALRITGSVSPETRVFAERRLVLEDDPVATLEGTAAPPPDTAKLVLRGPGDELAQARPGPHDRARDDEGELPGRASGRFRGSWTLSGAYVQTGDVAVAGTAGPARTGAGAQLDGEIALASRLARPLGPTLVDALHLGLVVGARTSERPGNTIEPYDGVMFSGTLEYRVLAGYRGEQVGVLAGLGPMGRTLQIGDLRTYGFVAPVVLRAEWRINGPATVTATAWALSPFTDTQSVGGELDFPLSRRGWVLVARGEWLRMPASVGDAPGRAATSASPETTALSFGIGKQL